MAAMIAENSYLIPQALRENYAELNRYLVVITDLDSELNTERDKTKEEIDKLKKTAFINMDVLYANVKAYRKDIVKVHREYYDK